MSKPAKTNRMRLIRLAGIVLLTVVVVNLHAVGAIWLTKTGLGAIGSSHPFVAIMIGALVLLAMFAIKHWFGVGRHRHGMLRH